LDRALEIRLAFSQASCLAALHPVHALGVVLRAVGYLEALLGAGPLDCQASEAVSPEVLSAWSFAA
jgi:hypothetical protein